MEYCKIFSGLMAHMSPHVKSFSQPQWRHSGSTVTAQWRHSGGTVATGKTQYFALVSNWNFQIKKNIFAALQGPFQNYCVLPVATVPPLCRHCDATVPPLCRHCGLLTLVQTSI